MGRTTFLSLKEPLKGRCNIVLSRSISFSAEGITLCHSIPEALNLVKELNAFVIGGAQIFKAFLPYATHLYLTRIHANYVGDIFFPAYDPHPWKLSYSKDILSASGLRLSFEKYRRLHSIFE